ncbi:MAG: D-alanine--D-alanine ligase [Kiritimatiellia bacterium]|nr:D-alanine--D-alanine ligase [Kiritimatiellia bacterium]MDP6630353.1 D-alanine--D-alanine ligase [Kiritimatiellia bacterium]MDP6810859.1 D-alanine--D-alanine ligase [Kiritimatiellia bacterium]MDP7024202.1 D-alanine--D-alanine ligase [Kiritimatiellia bacterium]
MKHVAVLKGGVSAERDVSLRSGEAIAEGLCEAGYAVTEVDVTSTDVVLPEGTDVVFIALHGDFGEDGEIQEILDGIGLPYTGSGADASRASYDKITTKERLVAAGIPTPGYRVVGDDTVSPLPLPVVVKPACQGSTIGIHCVREPEQWAAACRDAKTHGRSLVETYVPGRELTVGVVKEMALPVGEIIAPDQWYDYDAKYTSGTTQYIFPAELDDDVAQRCRELALDTFHVMGCCGFARVDFRLPPDGEPTVLEINTIPGFTATSLLPKGAAAAGIGFAELCAMIVESAVTNKDQHGVV